MSKNIIWTTQYCPFCDKAKQLMEDNNLEYEARLVDDITWKLEDLLGYAPNATTYPQIFLGNKHIGGCDDLQAHFALKEMSLGL